MKELRIKWEHKNRTYYGIARYYIDNTITFENQSGQTFDRLDVEDVENNVSILESIWEEIEDMASQEEDGIADVTEYNLI